MKSHRVIGRQASVTILMGALLALTAASIWVHRRVWAASTGGGPYSNQPLALSWDDSQLAVANPEAGTVSIFLVGADKNTKYAEVPVGKEPVGVAWSPDGTTL